MAAMVRKMRGLRELFRRVFGRASAPSLVIRCDAESFYGMVARVKELREKGLNVLLLVSRDISTPALTHAAREVPVVVALTNPKLSGEVLEEARLPLEPGLYEVSALEAKQGCEEIEGLLRRGEWSLILVVGIDCQLESPRVVRLTSTRTRGVLALRRVM